MKFVFLLSLLLSFIYASNFIKPKNAFLDLQYVTKKYCTQKNGIYSEDKNFSGNIYNKCIFSETKK